MTRSESRRAMLLRYGGFYGPGTSMAPGADQVELVRKRKLPIVGDGGGVSSFIHLADAADPAVDRGSQVRLADPIGIDAQRRELLRRLRDAQRVAMGEPEYSPAALLVAGIELCLQADLRWLEACERAWMHRRGR